MVKKKNIIVAVIELIISVLLLLLSIFDFGGLIKMVFVAIGLYLIIQNIIPLLFVAQIENKNTIHYVDIVMSILGIILGLILMFEHGLVVNIIIVVYLIIMPIIRIIKANNKLEGLKKEIPLFIVALLMILNIFQFLLQVVLIIAFSILTLLSIIALIRALFMKNDNNDNFNGNDNDNNSIKDDNVIDAEFKEI